MDFNSTITTKSAKETQALGKKVADSVKRGLAPPVICLYGQLGSGKTTFIQGFAQGLGLVNTRLLSPTFIIVRRYSSVQNSNFFYHIDLYRMHSEEEIRALGLVEIFADPTNFVAIEWAERLGSLLPSKRLDMHFSLAKEGKHLIRMEKF